jgi:lipoprotein-anchoring transpeptidase ErfK/SrfK
VKTFSIVEPTPTIEPVENLKAISGYNRIKLTWDKVDDADTYFIKRSDKKWTRDLHKLCDTYPDTYGTWAKTSKHPVWENYINVKMYKKYTYSVYAVKYVKDPVTGADKTVKSKVKKIKKKQCVNKLRIKVKIKSGTTLHSYNKKGKTYRIHSGQTIITDGYGGGKYYFKHNGAGFRIMNVRTYGEKGLYDKKKDYTEAEAEYFINDKDLKFARPSKTQKPYFIWASLYTQHVYIFHKDGNKWELVKDWDCSSGNPAAPSPTGNCSIGKRIEWRHHTHYWNCFSTLNALHGIKPVKYAGYNWVKYLGQMKSNGCIRNKTENAGWIWNHCSKGTKVLVR